MNVRCPRCGHVKKFVKGYGATTHCNNTANGIKCRRSLTRRHEIAEQGGE